MIQTDDLDRLIAPEKFATNWSGFSRRSNHVGSVIGTAQLVDANGEFIVGATVEIECKAPIVTDQCLMLFTLRKLSGKIRGRAYQLEVCPKEKRSHNGLTTIYGPHEHIGELEPTAVTEKGVECGDWDGSLAWFLQRINLSNLEIDKPC